MSATPHWRVIVVGGHTRSIGKTQLVCDIISTFPQANWIAGKITQYGHGVCAQNGNDCDCAPDEHICAIEWEAHPQSGTDSARFLAAGAKRSFWLRTKQGFLAEGLPLMRDALKQSLPEPEEDSPPLILESNSLIAISETEPLFRGDRSRPGRLQRLGSRRARPRRRADSSRLDGRPCRHSILDQAPRQSFAHQTLRLSARGRSSARALARAHRAGVAVPAKYRDLIKIDND